MYSTGKISTTPEENKKLAATSFRKGLLSKLSIVLIVFYVLFVMTAFNDNRPLAGFIAILQTIFSVLGWMMGAKIVPERIPGLHVVLIVISSLLIYPFMNTYN